MHSLERQLSRSVCLLHSGVLLGQLVTVCTAPLCVSALPVVFGLRRWLAKYINLRVIPEQPAGSGRHLTCI